MAWIRKMQSGGPVYLSRDRKAKIHVLGGKFVLRMRGKPKGARVELFEELAQAQAAYESGDLSEGLRARAEAAREG